MSTTVSTNKVDSSQRIENKWDSAISDAEKELHSLRIRAYRLRQAVQIFKANKRDGVPWPGENKKGPQEGGQ